jgi:hypothetical protein
MFIERLSIRVAIRDFLKEPISITRTGKDPAKIDRICHLDERFPAQIMLNPIMTPSRIRIIFINRILCKGVTSAIDSWLMQFTSKLLLTLSKQRE